MMAAPNATLPSVLRFGGAVLRSSPVLDTYFRFAAERQATFARRISGLPSPWTTDEIISTYRFTNVYRAADRVSQFLISEVIGHRTDPDDLYLRIVLFKIFNRIDTWQRLVEHFGEPTAAEFDHERYGAMLDRDMAHGRRVYSPAYIVPPLRGSGHKHRGHLRLIQRMLNDGMPREVQGAASLNRVFELLTQYPSIGPFLGYQLAIDLNYSTLTHFDENDFVVPGPGARDGIRKCFHDTGGLSEESIVHAMVEYAPTAFDRLELDFIDLWGRPLHAIDCQNLFCEVDKYARVAHPEAAGRRSKIKQRFRPNSDALSFTFPPSWGIDASQPLIGGAALATV